MEGGEVPRYVRPEILHHPLRHLLKLGFGVVEAGNEQGSDFEPHLRLVLHVDERFQHRLQVRVADLVIKIFGKALQVDVCRIHVAVKLAARLGANKACGYRNAPDAARVASDRSIGCVFMKDRRINVRRRRWGIRAAPPSAQYRQGSRARQLLTGFADVPVLAKFATQIAATRSKRQYGCSGQEVVERLLFHWVDAEAA